MMTLEQLQDIADRWPISMNFADRERVDFVCSFELDTDAWRAHGVLMDKWRLERLACTVIVRYADRWLLRATLKLNQDVSAPVYVTLFEALASMEHGQYEGFLHVGNAEWTRHQMFWWRQLKIARKTERERELCAKGGAQ